MGYIDSEPGNEYSLPIRPQIDVFPRPQTWGEQVASTEAWLDELCQRAEERREVSGEELQEALKVTLYFLPPQVAPNVRRLLTVAEQGTPAR